MRVHEAADRLVQERLRSIDDIGIGIARSERIAIDFHAVLKVCLVVHVERRAEFFGNFHHVHTTDMKMTIDDIGRHSPSSIVVRLSGSTSCFGAGSDMGALSFVPRSIC